MLIFPILGFAIHFNISRTDSFVNERVKKYPADIQEISNDKIRYLPLL